MTRPFAWRDDLRPAFLPTSASHGVKLGFVRVRGVAHHEIDADASWNSAQRPEVGVNAVYRGLVELEVARDASTLPAGLCKNTPTAPGMEWLHGEKLRREAAQLHLRLRA